MATEVWFRNPFNYVRELIETRTSLVAWDRGILKKKSIDPAKHAELYFPADMDYRLLVIGNQGAAEIKRGYDMSNPVAVYPVWEYGDDFEALESMCATNVGDDPESVNDMELPPDERPVRGQEHRVVVSRFPHAGSGPGRRFLRMLSELQQENPHVIIHLHGAYGYGAAFGYALRSADIEPRTLAAKGKVILPNGKEMAYERTANCAHWVTLLGWVIGKLSIPQERCKYNIESAKWAGVNYMTNVKFKTGRVYEPVAADAALATAPVKAETKSHLIGGVKYKPGDKVTCDTCSVASACKYFREGAVCSVPGTESEKLAGMFSTRNSDDIIDGLASLMGTNAKRLEMGREQEEDIGELDPEVTKIINNMFRHGVNLAKLVNPALATPKVGVQINTGGGPAAVAAGDPRKLASGIVRELEERGVKRDKITPPMIEAVVSGDEDKLKVEIEKSQAIDVMPVEKAS